MTEGGYRKACDAEYEACHILREQGWYVTRCYGERSPPDLFAAREGEFLLLMVRRSRRPVPGARAVSILYGEELDRLRSIGNPEVIRKECWVLSPPDGWKYYMVYPGGIRRVRHAGYDPDGEEYGDENRARAVERGMGRNGGANAITDPTGAIGADPRSRITGTIVLAPRPDPFLKITGTIVESPGADPLSEIAGMPGRTSQPDPLSRITNTTVESPGADPLSEIAGMPGRTSQPDPLSRITSTTVQSPEPDPLPGIPSTIVPVPQPDPSGTPVPVASDPCTATTGSPLPSSPSESSPQIASQVNGHA